MGPRMGSSSFAEFLKAFAELPEDEKKAAVDLADKECAGLKFVPNIGPQTEAYYCEADELFYGGAGGGGKTALLCGLAVNEHYDIHIFRREGVQLRGIIKELTAILGSTDGLNSTLGIWRVPGTGQTIELAGIKDEDDKIDWQGRAADLKCVAAGTLVEMADGSLKAIERVAVGDKVRTLSGPRRVTLLHRKKAQAVEVTARSGAVLARQVQGATHRLLTPEGWVAASDGPTEHRNHAAGATVYLAYPRQSADAAGRTPRSSRGDGEGCTPGRSHQLRSYRHPYTMEIRSAVEDVCVASLEHRDFGEMDLFDLTVEDANHYITSGGFINQNCFDEITHFTRSQYEFIIGWNRSTRPGQRCRVVATGNPPIDENGLWVIQYWAPWLDDTHPDPAAPGELRYPVRVAEDSDDTREIFFRTKAEALAHLATFKNPPRDLEGNIIAPRSRTFIPAKLEDNPDLMRSGYAAVLDKMPKELRDAMRDGKFKTAFVDDEFQVIPTEWIVEAQRRWKAERPHLTPMTAIGVDIAQGGADRTVMAPRYATWFAPLIAKPGRDTPDGPTAAALIIMHMRDAAVINIDLGGGWGGSAYDHLKANDAVALTGIVPGGASSGRTMDGRLQFKNIRAEMWWRFREALDPTSEHKIALPPDPELRSELAAPKWKMVGGTVIQIEEKADIKKRLGRSPDKGDAVVMSWFSGDTKKKRLEAKQRRWHDLPPMADLGSRTLHRHGRSHQSSVMGSAQTTSWRDEQG